MFCHSNYNFMRNVENYENENRNYFPTKERVDLRNRYIPKNLPAPTYHIYHILCDISDANNDYDIFKHSLRLSDYCKSKPEFFVQTEDYDGIFDTISDWANVVGTWATNIGNNVTGFFSQWGKYVQDQANLDIKTIISTASDVAKRLGIKEIVSTITNYTQNITKYLDITKVTDAVFNWAAGTIFEWLRDQLKKDTSGFGQFIFKSCPNFETITLADFIKMFDSSASKLTILGLMVPPVMPLAHVIPIAVLLWNLYKGCTGRTPGEDLFALIQNTATNLNTDLEKKLGTPAPFKG
jgi:hypothetical protein